MRRDSDDRAPGPLDAVGEANVLAHGILSRPVLARQHLIDNRDLFGGLSVSVSELASLQQRDPQRREIAGRNPANAAVRSGIVGTGRSALNEETRHASVIGERETIDERSRGDARDAAQTIFEGGEEDSLLFVFVIHRLRQRELRGNETVSLEARIHGLDFAQAAEQQSGSSQQEQRESNLHHHQRRPGALAHAA